MNRTRGFFGIGIYAPSKPANVGGLLRSAHAFGAAWTFTIGDTHGLYHCAANTGKSERHVPHVEFNTFTGLLSYLPIGCELVSVEITEGATELAAFKHPDRACYLLGGESCGLPPEMIDGSRHVVQIPTIVLPSLNVVSAASIVLYSRIAAKAAV